MKVGIIREGKVPPDSRVPLTPAQCKTAIDKFGIDLVVQPSPGRVFPDSAYTDLGIPLQEDLSDRDLLLGVKEVPVDMLIPNKSYCFFSHTHKKQVYNRPLLQAVLKKNIRLIDYELLTNDAGKRLIAFGKFAGMVGAHNGLWTYGKRTGQFTLPRMNTLEDYAAAQALYKTLSWPPMRIVLSGTGRVGQGAALVLRDMGIREVTPEAYLSESYDEAVFTILSGEHYVKRSSDGGYEKAEFYAHPERYTSAFAPYRSRTDLFINGIFWDNNAPVFFSVEDMAQDDFQIQVIADVTCDIAPVSSIPATLKASTIADPVFGFDPATGEEAAPFQSHVIDMMTIDNLPNELPRDASQSFGEQYLAHILPEFLRPERSEMLMRASIAMDGELGRDFGYLADFVEGK